MLPTLHPGDHLLVVPLPPRTGSLVAVRDPREESRIMIKRAGVVRADRSVEVVGDNPDHSTDSRTFGAVPPHLVLGRPVYRYTPPQRAGWLWRA